MIRTAPDYFLFSVGKSLMSMKRSLSLLHSYEHYNILFKSTTIPFCKARRGFQSEFHIQNLMDPSMDKLQWTKEAYKVGGKLGPVLIIQTTSDY